MSKQHLSESALGCSSAVETFSEPAPPMCATDATALPFGERAVGNVTLKNFNALIAADLLIDFCNDHGDVVTNLKLQKLLYYTQAWFLALHNKPLFADRLEAWMNGPTQPEVYAKYSSFGPRPIEQDTCGYEVSKSITKHIWDVMEVYGGFSAFDLQRLACDEEPWRQARRGLAHDEPSNAVIDLATMKRYYKAQLVDGKKKAAAS